MDEKLELYLVAIAHSTSTKQDRVVAHKRAYLESFAGNDIVTGTLDGKVVRLLALELNDELVNSDSVVLIRVGCVV